MFTFYFQFVPFSLPILHFYLSRFLGVALFLDALIIFTVRFVSVCVWQVEWAIRRQERLGVRWSAQGMLRVEQEAMRQLFIPTLNSISQVGTREREREIKTFMYCTGYTTRIHKEGERGRGGT